MADLLYSAYVTATVGNIFLLIILLYIFIQDYRDVKSKFTGALVLFAALLLLDAILSCPITSLFYLGSSCLTDITLHAFASIVEFIALLILTYTLRK